MNTLQTEIAKFLASCALERKKTTYPAVAEAIGWEHEHGRGLGSHLLEILKFCRQHDLPILTSILVPKGKPIPADDAVNIDHRCRVIATRLDFGAGKAVQETLTQS